MYASKRFAPILLAIGVAVPTVTTQAADLREERVRFAPGTTSATIKGTIRGYRGVDYVLRASAGQRMVVTLRTSNGANYFNVLPPGSTAEAIFIGSTKGKRYAGTLPSTGDYRIRVYLMRSAARRNEVGRYTLTIRIAAGASQQRRPGTAALRAGRGQFDATGRVPCAVAVGQSLAPCPFGVARDPGGAASVVVTWPDGRKRAIFFEGGKPVAADVSESQGKRPFNARREGDLHIIRIGPERYEIPEAVVTGG